MKDYILDKLQNLSIILFIAGLIVFALWLQKWSQVDRIEAMIERKVKSECLIK